MSRHRIFRLFCLGILLFVSSVNGQESVSTPAPGSRDLTASMWPLHDASLSLRGSSSCAAVACHGERKSGFNSSDSRGSEYVKWLEKDPHAYSALVLANDVSIRMLDHLGIVEEGRVIDQSGYDNCLACHAGRSDHLSADGFLFAGIGCESCHGPGERWVKDHHRGGIARSTLARSGMLDTRDLVTRARVCSDCHVGSAERQVDHDLIAAGHPKLRFEMAMFHNRLPKHWHHPAESLQSEEFQLALWLAGQVAASDAGLALLQARCGSSQGGSVWPEFSEYNCGSCHHELRFNSSRGSAAVQTALPGWGDWNYFWLQAIWQQDGGGVSESGLKSLADLRSRMTGLGPAPQSEAEHLRSLLNEWATGTDRGDLHEFARRAVRESIHADNKWIRSREQATQQYLALLSVQLAEIGLSGPDSSLRQSLGTMKAALQPDSGFFETPSDSERSQSPVLQYREGLRTYGRSLSSDG